MSDLDVGVEHCWEVAEEEVVEKDRVVGFDEERVVGREGLGSGFAVWTGEVEVRVSRSSLERVVAEFLESRLVEVDGEGFHLSK